MTGESYVVLDVLLMSESEVRPGDGRKSWREFSRA